MRLLFFHKILIGTATLFGVGFSVREFFSYTHTGNPKELLISVASVTISGVLVYYLKNLKRFLALP